MGKSNPLLGAKHLIEISDEVVQGGYTIILNSLTKVAQAMGGQPNHAVYEQTYCINSSTC